MAPLIILMITFFTLIQLEIQNFLVIEVKKLVGEQQITLDATQEAVTLLADKGYDPQFGARPVKRVIQRLVLNQLSKDILSGKVTTNSVILLDAFDGELVFRN